MQTGPRTGNIIGVLIGVILFLSAQDIFDDINLYKLIVPVILIIIGIRIIFGDRLHLERIFHGTVQGDSTKKADYVAVFGGQDVNYAHDSFKGASLISVFGGINLNLRDAVIDEDVYIYSTSIFGGSEIILPDSIRVEVKAVPIFGGVSNKYRSDVVNGPIVYINSTCIFGGDSIK